MSNPLFEGFGMVNISTGITWAFYFFVAIGGMIIFAALLYYLMDRQSWNIKAYLSWPVGNPYYTYHKNPDGSIIKKLVISIEEQETSAKLYNKRIKAGSYKQYFNIKDSNFDRINYFEPHYFFRRIKRGAFDTMTTGIRLFMHPQKGPIPLSVQNPTLEIAPTSMNTVISAYVNTQKDISEKYENDFWTKYGAVITVSLILVTIVASFIFMIKIQEISWTRAAEVINRLIAVGKENLAPNLT